LAERVPARLTPAEGRRFGLTVGGAFLVLAALARWRGHSTSPAITGSLGALLLLAGILLPGRLGPVYRAWMAFAHALSKVTTPVFMSLAYALVFTPAGILMRAFGHRPLSPDRARGSFWVSRTETRAQMERQF
jgi:saxitoxin biosynthesis operon SxtJ-like protein